MEYQTIVSQSGMTHYRNPAGGTFKVAVHRKRAWCDFHVDERIVTAPNGEYCQFCPKAIAEDERRKAA